MWKRSRLLAIAAALVLVAVRANQHPRGLTRFVMGFLNGLVAPFAFIGSLFMARFACTPSQTPASGTTSDSCWASVLGLVERSSRFPLNCLRLAQYEARAKGACWWIILAA